MTKAELLKKNRNQIGVLKDLLFEEIESRNKLELNYKYLSNAVNSGLRENSELKAENVEAILKINSTFEEIIVELKAEIVELKENKEWVKAHDIDKLLGDANKEIAELKADYKNDMDASEELDDKHSKIIRDLEQENDSLEDQLKNAVYDYDMLMNSDAIK